MFFETLKLCFKQINMKTEQVVARIMFSKSMTISIAESCTGGLISSRLTDVSGSSFYIKENYITYSNEAKIKLLGVSGKTLEEHGAVSEECAREMVEGLFERTDCDISLATTGFAEQGKAETHKKAGLLYVAVKNKYTTRVKKFEIDPRYKRKTMKFLFSQKALEFLIEFLKETDKVNSK